MNCEIRCTSHSRYAYKYKRQPMKRKWFFFLETDNLTWVSDKFIFDFKTFHRGRCTASSTNQRAPARRTREPQLLLPSPMEHSPESAQTVCPGPPWGSQRPSCWCRPYASVCSRRPRAAAGRPCGGTPTAAPCAGWPRSRWAAGRSPLHPRPHLTGSGQGAQVRPVQWLPRCRLQWPGNGKANDVWALGKYLLFSTSVNIHYTCN